jgi:pimeloyl-ACP methyl ester carboxylesterase
MKNMLIKTLVPIVLLVLSKLLLSCDNDTNEDRKLKEQMVAVNNYKIYTRTLGQKQPTIVLMTGIGGTTADFEKIESNLSPFGKIVNYDREGLGKSPWTKNAKDSETIAKELYSLLLQTNNKQPVIIIAHSLGGLHARKFMAMYPNSVSGLILIDPTPEDLVETIIAQLPQDYQIPAREAMKKEFEMLLAELPEGAIKEEYKAIESCYNQARALQNKTAIPIEIISSMKITEGTSELSLETAKQLRDALLDKMSTGPNRHTLTYSSGHFIQKEEPQLIVNAVQWIMKQQ